jgi:hypothetical protein
MVGPGLPAGEPRETIERAKLTSLGKTCFEIANKEDGR